MKTKIYIIPGLGESCNVTRYKKLATSLSKKGYRVIPVNPDWYKPLTELVFKVENNAIIIGFSFGAVLAYLISKKQSYGKAIFASMSPIEDFAYDDLVKDNMPYMKEKDAILLAKDVKSITIDLKKVKTPFITLKGEKEEIWPHDITPDIIVPDTKHYMPKKYIEAILKLV